MTDPTLQEPAATDATAALEAPARRRVLLPLRGLVCASNRRGRPYPERDLARWLRLNRVLHKTDKCDFFAPGPIPPVFRSLLAYSTASAYGQPGDIKPALLMPLSLRTDCPPAVPELTSLKADGMLDILLAPRTCEDSAFRGWLDAASGSAIPVRVQVQPPFDRAFDPAVFAGRLADAGVPVLTIVNEDPFQPRPPCTDETDARRTLDLMNDLAEAAQAAGLETNLYGLPSALVRERNRDIAGGRRRFFLDHQQYHKASYELAEHLYRASPRMAALAIAAYLGRYTSIRNLPDEFILRWVIEGDRHAIYHALIIMAKFVRRLRLWPTTAQQREGWEASYRQSVALLKENGYGPFGPEFDTLRTPPPEAEAAEDAAFRQLMPGVRVDANSSDVRTVWKGLEAQHKHYDRLDADRLIEDADARRLGEHALQTVQAFSPDTEYGHNDIRPVNSYGLHMPGAIRWHTLFDREVQSYPVFLGDLPFTIQITLGGGIADFVGFSIWDAIKIVCPMESFAHTLVLHAAEDGRFVLLRDGEPVKPVEFVGKFHTPRRLPTYNEVRVSIWNINGEVCTQSARVWVGEKHHPHDTGRIRHTVLIVSTRYARRLQAVLLGIAHQQGVDLRDIEVVVGYVPGIDATDDVLNSVQASHPDLRIIRSPFPERRLNAKGFIINQSLKQASGKWVTLLDSDIILPNDYFSRIDALPGDCYFAAPQGRKMLTREATARVLLGELQPWREWDAILAGPGEERYGDKREGGLYAPIGFCQCVRRECFDKIGYNEYEHFEGADWEFACAMLEHFGHCTFLEVPALHLDHGGSQWYGAKQQQ